MGDSFIIMSFALGHSTRAKTEPSRTEANRTRPASKANGFVSLSSLQDPRSRPCLWAIEASLKSTASGRASRLRNKSALGYSLHVSGRLAHLLGRSAARRLLTCEDAYGRTNGRTSSQPCLTHYSRPARLRADCSRRLSQSLQSLQLTDCKPCEQL